MKLLNKMTSKIKGVFVNPTIEHINPLKKGSMIGAGVKKLEKEFITHTTLIHHKSAVHTFVLWQKLFLSGLVGIFLTGLALNWLLTLQLVVAILTVIYFIDVLFNLFLVLKSLHLPPELDFDDKELTEIKDIDLPIYTILCPMYKEAKIIPSFLEAISKLDWPKNKLDVQLLLEEDDIESINVAKNLGLPSYVRAIIVPHSQPKTKPKACNYGLNIAKGEYLVIYDAEDIPDPKQLKKAYLAFQSVDKNVVCLQAKLNYFNPHQNFITRLFTAEYSLWFDVVLPGLQGINTNIPLGGTSNHFRISDLKSLEGWDPFNVTEDCDLGVRLFMEGKKTAVINSTTLEEANSKFKNWLRQRSRWIKGYMQTYLVHMRNPYQLVKKQGIHALFFNLIVGGKIAFMFINPFLWLATIGYFVLHAQLGAIIESLYPSYIFYMALFSLVFGNFLYMFYYMIGCAKRGHWSVIKYVYLVPFYWIMTSIAAVIALQQLFFKPHYWEKTVHGLHLSNQKEKELAVDMSVFIDQVIDKERAEGFPVRIIGIIVSIIGQRKVILSGGMLVLAGIFSNFVNFFFNAYLGRSLSFEEFGVLSLLGSILFISSIPINALGSTIAHKTAFLFGKHSKSFARSNLAYYLRFSITSAILTTIIWILLIPSLTSYFQLGSSMALILFTPVWSIGLFGSTVGGFIDGTLSFGVAAIALAVEAVTKLGLAILFVWMGLSDYVFLAIIIGLFVHLITNLIFVLKDKTISDEHISGHFEFKFYLASFINGLSKLSFLSLDVILAKHYLSPVESGQYALLSLTGKIVFFAGTLFAPFMLPIVSKKLGANQSSVKVFKYIFILTLVPVLLAYIGLGVFSQITIPLLFGEKAKVIIPFASIYLFSIVLFSCLNPVISYFQAKRDYIFIYQGMFTSIILYILIHFFHRSLSEFVLIIFIASSLNTMFAILLYIFNSQVNSLISNFRDLIDLAFSRFTRQRTKEKDRLQILIFNWRDTKHVWGGGAEIYIHEIAKNWVQNGHRVTVFCGNDNKCERNEVIDGVQIVRRGGFFTVYLWAFLYYVLRFRGLFDVVIDCENGIPFFTPLYVRKPKYLLIHHIHQEVFRQHLRWPFNFLAMFLEARLMPVVYFNQRVITVSESSKIEILKLKIAKFKSIDVVNPGVNSSDFKTKDKFLNPTIIYVGRLKPYKNIDIAINAVSLLVKKNLTLKFLIVGNGEHDIYLKNIVKQKNLTSTIEFTGFVGEEKKNELLAKSWLMVQPSMMEGWGISVIEANAAGTPVVASNVNGLKDSVVDSKTGILVTVKDAKALASAIEKVILSASLRSRLSRNALAWAKLFEWDIKSSQLINIIYSNLFLDLQKSKSKKVTKEILSLETNE